MPETVEDQRPEILDATWRLKRSLISSAGHVEIGDSVEPPLGAVLRLILRRQFQESEVIDWWREFPPVSPGAWIGGGAPRGRQRSTVSLVG